MSVDIAWDVITSGADGEALADTIRAFVDAKFQQITLPRFINAVHVHSFEFGSVCPEIEIKDICDPLPDFYDDDEEEQPTPSETLSSEFDDRNFSLDTATLNRPTPGETHTADLHNRVAALQNAERGTTSDVTSRTAQGSGASHYREGTYSPADMLPGPFARSGTPGIPGGTSNMGYFHFPVGGLSGAQTPLAAVAGGGAFTTQAWLNDQQSRNAGPATARARALDVSGSHGDSTSHTRTAGSISSPELGSPFQASSPDRRPTGYFPAQKVGDEVSATQLLPESTQAPADKVSPSDLQVVARVTYDGDVRMMLTAEIMLDYPMPSFIKIPLRLSITGVSFDGVAILAYMKKNMHFCFLDPEDANTLVGHSFANEKPESQKSAGKKMSIGSLLQEIRVETEIGRQENGKQVLKNVGKVERFVLEEVRRIFEEEFVFPSFWTFLV